MHSGSSSKRTGPKVLGALLAGGRSRRFGSDKALAVSGGKPLIAHAAAALDAIADAVVICGRGFPPYLALPDIPDRDMGPLGGLNAALNHAQDNGFDGVLCTGCDMPLFPRDLARALIAAGAAVVEGQHLMGWWPAALAQQLHRHLQVTQDRSVRTWLAHIGPRIVSWPALPNINTPADLQAWDARQAVSASRGGPAAHGTAGSSDRPAPGARTQPPLR